MGARTGCKLQINHRLHGLVPQTLPNVALLQDYRDKDDDVKIENME